MVTKDQFDINPPAGTVTCPIGVNATIRRDSHGDGTASLGSACAGCPLRTQRTTAAGGRTIAVGRHEQRLTQARAAQQDPAWRADYRATRPKVERRLGQLMRRKHGGRRARMRGQDKIDADFNLLAVAHNIARLAMLGLRCTPQGWATATT
jgi:Transposase DDE domain